jgi:penicillin-binding protein-related factor A (putative recombinase)
MKNTGKPTEKLFESVWDRMGKKAYYYRIPDAAELFGRNRGTILNVRPTPSDYVVTTDGSSFYAEVKSSQNKTAFPFNLFKKGQSAAAPQVLSAGGAYFVFAHNLTTGTWYRIPWQVIQAVKDLGRSSIPWTELENLKWTHQPS